MNPEEDLLEILAKPSTGPKVRAELREALMRWVQEEDLDYDSRGIYSVKDYGAIGDGVTNDTGAINAVLAAVPVGGTILLPSGSTFRITSPIVLSKKVRVVGHGATITNSTSTQTFRIDAGGSGTRLEGLTLTGPGSGSVHALGYAIHTTGTVAAPVTDITLSDLTISGFSKAGMWLERCVRLAIRDCNISDIAYAGILTLGCQWVTISGNKIRNLTQPVGYINSYGIALTRNSSLSMELGPRTSDVTVIGNIIDGVPLWEGIDSHAGERLTIVGNEVYNCRVGIAMVGCDNESNVETWACRDVTIVGNTIRGGVTNGTNRAGIQLVGVGPSAGNPAEYATGVISGNIVEDHGTENSSLGSGIVLYFTEGASVTGNMLRQPSLAGILLYHTNSGFCVTGNTIIDAWTDSSSFTAGIYVSSTHNTGYIGGNNGVRGSKSAAIVNQRGIYINAGASTGSSIYLNANNFSSFTIPINDSGNLGKNQFSGKMLGFYGVAPVARAAAIASPTADAAALKTAVDAIRVALANVGIIS